MEKDNPGEDKKSRIKFITPIIGAIVWGAFFILFVDFTFCDSGITLFSAVLIFLWRQIICQKKYGDFIFKIRWEIVLLICILAHFAPCKNLDRIVITFPKKNISLREVIHHCYPNAHQKIRQYPIEKGIVKVTLPENKLSMRKLLHTLEEQANVVSKNYYCLSGANLLFGASLRSINLQRGKPENNNSDLKFTIPNLIEAVKDDDYYTRLAALEILYGINCNDHATQILEEFPFNYKNEYLWFVEMHKQTFFTITPSLQNQYNSEIQKALPHLENIAKDKDKIIQFLAQRIIFHTNAKKTNNKKDK